MTEQQLNSWLHNCLYVHGHELNTKMICFLFVEVDGD